MKRKFQLATVFSDGMVLQRRQPVNVFGTGEDGTHVTVTIGSVSAACVVKDGRWNAVLPPMEAADGLSLRAECSGTVLFVNDAAIGEVWVAGGQSNMEFWLRNEAERETVIPRANDPLLRFFDMPRISYDGQEKDLSFAEYGRWRPFLPEHAGWFSAVGAYFGVRLRQALGVPVAVIGCNCGSTSASCWMSEAYLDAVPALSPYRATYEKALETLDLDWYTAAFKERQTLHTTPRLRAFYEQMARGELSSQKATEIFAAQPKRQLELLNLPIGPMSSTRPCALYHFMVGRLAPYTAKGVIWYQGESDVGLAEQYAVLFRQLVRCWRDAWGQELPFLTVQLAPFEHWLENTGERFPELRRQQDRAAESISNVWMVSIMDAGMKENIHPTKKRVVGERLALLARGKVYGENSLVCEAPVPEHVSREGEVLTLRFANAGKGLVCAADRPAELEVLSDGVPISYTAQLCGAELVLRAKGLADAGTVELRYAQNPFTQADLYNSAGLCAKPFAVKAG